MNEPKSIECDDYINPATGAYAGSPQKPENLKANDFAVLTCRGISVIVQVKNIDSDNITGVVHSFENYDEEDLNGVREGDLVQFERKKIQTWHQ